MRSWWIYSLLAVPAVLRLAIEVLTNPLTVGFDTLAYYYPYLVGFDRYSPLELYGYSPLYYVAAAAVNAVTGNPMLTVKALAVALQALFTVSLYAWASRRAGLVRGAVYALAVSLYFPVLRIEWDLHRNVLGLALALLTVWALNRGQASRNYILALALAVLTALAHPIGVLVLTAILIPRLTERGREAICVLVALWLVEVSVIAAGLATGSSYISKAVTCNTQLPHGLEVLELALYTTLPVLPLVVVGLRRGWRELDLALWSAMCVVVAPLIAAGYRLTLTLAIPALMYVAIGGRRALGVALAVAAAMAALYVAMPPSNPFTYFAKPFMWRDSFKYAVPTSFMQNTIPLSWGSDALHVAREAVKASNRGLLVTDRVLLPYVLMAGRASNITVCGEVASAQAVNECLTNTNATYLLRLRGSCRWYGITNDVGGTEVLAIGCIGLYQVKQLYTGD